MPAVQQDRLRKFMSFHDNLQCEDGELTNNPVTVLGDIVLDGLFPAESLLSVNFNTNTRLKCRSGDEPLSKPRRERSQRPLL